MGRRPLNITLHDDVRTKLRDLAGKAGRSMSSYIEYLVLTADANKNESLADNAGRSMSSYVEHLVLTTNADARINNE